MKLGRKAGFTLIEVVVVISVIGTLAAIVYTVVVPKHRERAYYIRSLSEMGAMANALTLYVSKYNDYPPDASRGVPSGIEEFLQSHASENWPNAPYPGSVYDWENWAPGAYGAEQTYQISIRFCSSGQDSVCNTYAKKYLANYVDTATLNAWDAQSSMYYCIKGSCRAAQSQAASHAGYCVNCSGKSKAF